MLLSKQIGLGPNAFSITWSNLFELTSAPLTVAPPHGAFDILRKFPSSVVARIVSSKKFFEYSFLGTRWYCRTDLSNSMSWVKVVTRFGSSLAKASLVGANMVYGPSPEMVSFKSTSANSLSKVVAFSSSKMPTCWNLRMMVFKWPQPQELWMISLKLET